MDGKQIIKSAQSAVAGTVAGAAAGVGDLPPLTWRTRTRFSVVNASLLLKVLKADKCTD